MRSLLASFLLGSLVVGSNVGCGGTTVDAAPPDAAASETAVDAALDGTPETATSDASADAACACASVTVAWEWNGGEVAWIDRMRLAPCDDYVRERFDPGSTAPTKSCTAKLPRCSGEDAAIGVADVEAALAHPDVKAALAAAPILYGSDSRPVDGAVFRITVAGKQIEVGGACGGASGCTEVPAGVAALKSLLLEIDDVRKSDCPGF